MAATVSVHRPQPGSDKPRTSIPTVAPVLNFSCLFTHDLKRKQKRWQDGRLTFHTFNKRVMVYDDRGNFIGDTHWREEYDFEEGEEFQLERGCVIVQVVDCLGSKDQDLTELFEKRHRQKDQRQQRANANVSSPASAPRRPAPPFQGPGAVPLQSPLPRQATTPRAGPIGRAVIPTVSPYEQRRMRDAQGEQHDDPPPEKKKKTSTSVSSKSGYAQSLFGATLSLSPWTSSIPSVQNKSSQTSTQRRNPAETAPAPLSIIRKPNDRQSRLPLSPPTNRPATTEQPSRQVLASTPANAFAAPAAARLSACPVLENDSTGKSVTNLGQEKIGLGACAPTNRMRPFTNKTTSYPSERGSSAITRDRRQGQADKTDRPALQQDRNVTHVFIDPEASQGGADAQELQENDQGTRKAAEDVNYPSGHISAQPSEKKTSLISSTKRSKRRGLLIVSENSFSTKRRKQDDNGSVRPRQQDPTTGIGNYPVQHGTRKPLRSSISGNRGSKSMSRDRDVFDPRDVESPGNSELESALGERVQIPSDDPTDRLQSRKSRSRPSRTDSADTDHDAETSDFEDLPFPDEPITMMSRSNRNPIKYKENLPHKGPRLTSIRRSVKSKEIIGFHSDDLDPGYALEKPKISSPVRASDLLRNASHNHEINDHGELGRDMAQPGVNQPRNQSPGKRFQDTERTGVDKAGVTGKSKSSGYTRSPELAKSKDADVSSSGIYRQSESGREPAMKAKQKAETPQPSVKCHDAEVTTKSSPDRQVHRNGVLTGKPQGDMNTQIGSEDTQRQEFPGSREIRRTSSNSRVNGADTGIRRGARPNADTHEPPRIANPASRNRKSATTSDAAGQVPQSIIGSATVTTEPNGSGKTGPHPLSNQAPGFTRANGGPWSKTAHDLLGIKRPSL